MDATGQRQKETTFNVLAVVSPKDPGVLQGATLKRTGPCLSVLRTRSSGSDAKGPDSTRRPKMLVELPVQALREVVGNVER